jgi:MFS family permease
MRLPATFAPLRHRNYRLYFTGQGFSLLGSWMEQTGRSWLVTLLAARVAAPGIDAAQLASYYLGLLTTVGSLPMLFGALFGGLAADRFSKKTLIASTQTAQMLLSLGMAALVFSGKAAIVHVFLFALLIGLTQVIDIPARQSLVSELVEKDDLAGAIGLNSSLFNGSRMIGPALAGTLIGALGGKDDRAVAICFALNGLSYLTLLVALSLMGGEFPARAGGKESPLIQLKEAARYLKEDRPVRTLLQLLAGYSIFTIADWILLPSLARFTLGADARQFGLLTSLKGLGAWLGALTIASLSSSSQRIRLLQIAAIVSPLLMLAIALSGRYGLVACLMPLNGFFVVCFLANTNGLLQTSTPEAMRGRIMGVHAFLMMGLNPIGGLWAGELARRTSASMAMAFGAGVTLLLSLLTLTRSRELHRLADPPP